MRRWFLAAITVAAIVLSGHPVEAVGTVTVTTLDVGAGITRYRIVWTSDASGAVSGNGFAVKPGLLIQVKFVPNGGGTQPTNLYDVTLLDTDNVDVIGGGGVDRSNVTGSILNATIQDPYFHDAQQNLDLVVANAGNAKGGTVYLWVR